MGLRVASKVISRDLKTIDTQKNTKSRLIGKQMQDNLQEVTLKPESVLWVQKSQDSFL